MSDCKHENWEILGSERLGLATCKDCKEEVNLKILFNDLHERMIDALDEVRRFGV